MRKYLPVGAVACVAAMILAAPGAAFAQDLDSTPLEAADLLELQLQAEEAAALGEAPLAAEAPATIAGKVSIGLEFELDRHNGFIPPDTMGAVGPNHIVLMINGRYRVFDKLTGLQLDDRSLDSFWTNVAGLGQEGLGGGRFDPRIVFDTDTDRWFAVSIDKVDDNVESNHVFVARTEGDDPTVINTWKGAVFDADTLEPFEFHDYPTLAVDADGLYVCTQDFGDEDNLDESCYSIPKDDLIQNPPSIANLARFENSAGGDLPAVAGSWQPVLNMGISAGGAPLLGSTGGGLVRTTIHGAATPLAWLGTSTVIAGDPGHGGPPPARQPHPDGDPTVTIENVAPRFVSNVVQVGDSIWAVHAVLGNGVNSALRWYEIDEPSNAVVQTGLIDNPNRDFHEPSIAVNQRGDVVIGYTCSGPNLAASTCVSIGETTAGTTTFESPAIVSSGLGTYWVDYCDEPDPDCGERNRWGDYSATVVDPVDPCTFWTFQEYVAQGAVGNVGPQGEDGLTPRDGNGEGGLWGVRVAELTVDACSGGDILVIKDCKPERPLLVGETATCTILVKNLGPGTAVEVNLVDTYLSDGTFTISNVEPSAACTATLNPQNGWGQVSCELGNMAPDEVITVTAEISADTAHDVNDHAVATSHSIDPNPDNNTAHDTVVFVLPGADLAIQKTCTQPVILAGGDPSVCTIVVSNLGPDEAAGIKVIDNISSGDASNLFDYAVDDGIGTCSPLNGSNVSSASITCNLASLASGSQWVITVDESAGTPMTITDTVTVSSSGSNDPDGSNNQAEATVVVTAGADLGITKTVDHSPVTAGLANDLVYTITVTNYGPSAAINVVVSDTLPAGLIAHSVTSSSGSCNPGVPGDPLQAAVCGFDSIANGASETMTITATVDPAVPDGTVLQNNAVVSADSADDNNANDYASASATVHAVADLEIEKTDSPDPAIAGDVLNYLITITNNGPSVAQGVVLQDDLPNEVTLTSSEVFGKPGTCTVYDEVDNLVACNIGDMAPGEEAHVSMTVLIDPGVDPGTVIVNDASVESGTDDSNPGNNATSEETTVNTSADLWLDKTGNFVTGNPSTTIHYFLQVHNKPGESTDDPQNSGDGGPSDARNVVVIDQLPFVDGKKNQPIDIIFVSEQCVANHETLTITCTTPYIEVGQSALHEIHIQVEGKMDVLVNEAWIDSSDTPDPTSSNNADSLEMVVKGGSDRPGGPGGGRGRGGGGKK